MAQELIIGRSASSALPVPADKVGVSGEHVKITIDGAGHWTIEDLGSANGTYIQDANGDFQQVFKKRISEDTIIRLGTGGHNSFTFMAHRAAAPQSSYMYEFQVLGRIIERLNAEQDQLDEKDERNSIIASYLSVGALTLSIGIQYIIPGMKEHPDINLNITRALMILPPIIVRTFFGSNKQGRKRLKQKSQKLLICPKCGKPISEFDINNLQCSKCKAK